MDKVHERPVVTEANKEAVRAGHTGDHLRYILIQLCAVYRDRAVRQAVSHPGIGGKRAISGRFVRLVASLFEDLALVRPVESHRERRA